MRSYHGTTHKAHIFPSTFDSIFIHPTHAIHTTCSPRINVIQMDFFSTVSFHSCRCQRAEGEFWTSHLRKDGIILTPSCAHFYLRHQKWVSMLSFYVLGMCAHKKCRERKFNIVLGDEHMRTCVICPGITIQFCHWIWRAIAIERCLAIETF